MPKDPVLQAKMEKCVADVVKKGKPKKSAIPICYASLMKKGKDVSDDFILDMASLDPALLVEGMDVEEVEDEMGKSMDDLKRWVKDQFAATREMLGLKHEAGSDHTMAAHSDKTKKCPKCGKWVEPKGDKCPECDAAMSKPKEMSEGAMIYKDAATGAYRWLAVFSNKFRDRDNPPEIICDAAHQDFVKAVNAGEWPMPEYRLWHIKAPIGRADYLAYHDAGFAVASGTITKGLEPVAEMMREVSFRWINSHGMPVGEIRREDPNDKTIITRYRSKEITALPEWAAANELTFNFIGEEEMGFNDKDRERLTQMFGDKATEVEKLLDNAGKSAEDAGVESKDKTPTTDAPAATPVDAPAETPIVVDAAKDETSAPADNYPTREEVADVLKPLAEAVSQLTGAVTELQSGLKELRSLSEQKDRDMLASTPAASLAELVRASVTSSKPDEARLKGRTNASMSGPKETPVPASPEAQTGFRRVPFLAELTQSGGATPPQEKQNG
jgi:hypothetical protein